MSENKQDNDDDDVCMYVFVDISMYVFSIWRFIVVVALFAAYS